MQKNENFAKQAEQAEAERPEVVAWQYRVTAGPQTGWSLWHPGKGEEFERSYTVERRPLMTVAQHDRIVGELRAERDGAIKLLGQSVWQKIERLTQERDAALARVAELERGKVYVEARQCDECQHGGINDSATGVAACHECDWTGPEPEEDRCPGCQRENCMAAACPQCGARYVLVASEEIAAPVAQAQHSVPELLEWAVDRWHAEVSLRPLINVHRRALDDTWRQVIRHLGGDTGLLCGPSHDELLAAAPGKEVGHE
ncbi:hypothetical protein LZM85_02185 [Pseudomonas aeruginosa]|nr:hypothetical protein [Pseudomonas aeruginosa]